MAAASEEANSSEERKPTEEKCLEVNSNEIMKMKMKLEDLKVAELKIELGKRDLDMNGVKSVLLERLKAAIVEEGENPEEYNFEISSGSSSNKNSLKKLKEEISADSSSDKNSVKKIKEEISSDSSDKNGIKKEDISLNSSSDKNSVKKLKEDISLDSSSDKNSVKKLTEEISLDSSSDKNSVKKLKEEISLDTSPDIDNVKKLKEEMSLDTSPDKNSIKKLEEEITSDASSDKNSVNKLEETTSTNGAIVVNDDINNHEEKMDVMLQLSIDEEEAQLNEESLIDIEKPSDIENNKIVSSEHLGDEPCEGDKDVAADKSTSPKTVKTSVQNKTTDTVPAVLPKVLKVVGKSDKMKNLNVLAKSLWITGLPNTTRAADLKALFSKQGKVLSVKIVKSTKQTPGKCYGYVTMATSKDTTKSIQNLHRTELNGRIISVERKQNEPTTLLKKLESKLLTSTKKVIKKDVSTPKQTTNEKTAVNAETKEMLKVEKKNEDKKTGSEISEKKIEEKTNSAEKSKDKDRKLREHREKDTHRSLRRPGGFRPRSFGYNDRPKYGNFRRPFGRRPFSNRVGFGSTRPNAYTAQKLREERFQRERLRERREIEHTRADERHRYIERKQKEEQYRLEREKERLRMERELLERERAEIIKFEREKQRMERERIEREREELRRQAELRRGSKRPFVRDSEPVWEDRKKPATRYNVRSNFPEVPSSSRFEFPSRERSNFNREYIRHPDKFSAQKHPGVLPRADFGNRGARREITIRTRDERQVFNRSDIRDNRRNLGSRERERNSSSRRDIARSDWKHDRRVNERIVSTNSSSGPRRMTYY